MSGVRISVITPVYNGERFIGPCLRSVAEQAEPGVEHLVIDGGSTDRTVAIVKEFAARHQHIRWLSEKDAGQSDAMNKGIALAAGDILGFLNADDFYEPGALARALRMFDSLPEPALLVGNCNVIDEKGTLLSLNKPDTRYYQLLQVWRFKMPNNPSSYFYHRSLHERVGGYDTAEHYVMDYDFLLRAFGAAKVVYVDETFGNFRYYPGTKTSDSVDQGGLWKSICRVSRKYAAERGPLYRLHVALGILLLNESLESPSRPSLYHRVKRRLLRLIQTVFDRVIAVKERVWG
jgi:glycosyltransferase involved in cell wall biosynthesis